MNRKFKKFLIKCKKQSLILCKEINESAKPGRNLSAIFEYGLQILSLLDWRPANS